VLLLSVTVTLAASESPKEYAEFMKGVHFLSKDETKKVLVKGETFESLYGSTKIVNQFNIANKIYKTSQDIDSYIDPSIMLNMK